MPAMWRKLFTVAAGASAVLCVAALVVWVSVSGLKTEAEGSFSDSRGWRVQTGPLGLHLVSHSPSVPKPPATIATGSSYELALLSVDTWGTSGYAEVAITVPWPSAILSPAAFAVCCLVVARWPKRHGPGLCPACGYDLRATPGRCPECGAVPGGVLSAE